MWIIIQFCHSESTGVKSSQINFIFFIYNRKDCSESIVWSISFHNKLSIGDSMCVSSSQMIDLVFLYFTFHFYFLFDLFFYFLFLEQLGLGLIGHAVTSVTTWWCSHKTDHETWENEVKGFRTSNVTQHKQYILALCSTHGHLG